MRALIMLFSNDLVWISAFLVLPLLAKFLPHGLGRDVEIHGPLLDDSTA